jgi:hypothetical protein
VHDGGGRRAVQGRGDRVERLLGPRAGRQIDGEVDAARGEVGIDDAIRRRDRSRQLLQVGGAQAHDDRQLAVVERHLADRGIQGRNQKACPAPAWRMPPRRKWVTCIVGVVLRWRTNGRRVMVAMMSSFSR